MTDRRPVAIVFDTFGTVVDWRSSLIADLTAFGGARHQRGLDRPGGCLARGVSPVHGPGAQRGAAVDHAGWAAPRIARPPGGGVWH